MALRIRVPGRRQERDAGRPSRIGSFRAALLVLAVIPSLALVTLWAVSTLELGRDWQAQRDEKALAAQAGIPANMLYFNLQEERRLSAKVLASPDAASRAALREQRSRTDEALDSFLSLSDIDAADAPEDLRGAVALARGDMRRIDDIRRAVDGGTATQTQAFRYFTELIAVDLRLFETLSRSENSEVTARARVLIDLFWAKEMLSREDAVLARGWTTHRLTEGEHNALAKWIGAQHVMLESRIEPHLPPEDLALYRQMITSGAWETKEDVERALLGAHSHDGGTDVPLPRVEREWRQSVDDLNPRLQQLITNRTIDVNRVGQATIDAMLVRLIALGAIGLGAVLLVVALNVWITTVLRRRISALRQDARELETKLPEVVERLRRGESVDPDVEVREAAHGRDELGRLGQALNLARRSAVETAVREVEQHRGFERLLQRIARRTQLLIGLQMKKLDEMERRHEDPEVLEGLFDLDHLTARLRRYEENLVILAGGQPQRRWRKPVKMLDVLRAALGEVQDYRRIQIEVQGQPWLTGRAVGPVVHVLAELMENAAAFSKPPTPVEVRAGMVGQSLVVEVEDRGLGMEPEMYEHLNRFVAEPPRMDMLSRADDARLGMYVVARLASGLGLGVEFRPSVLGGTRVIVHIPAELVADAPDPAPSRKEAGERRGGGPRRRESHRADGNDGGGDGGSDGIPSALPTRSRGRAMSSIVPAPVGPSAGSAPAEHGGTGSPDGPGGAEETARRHPDGADTSTPLPRRVRQASLAPELRKPARRSGAGASDEDTLTLRPEPRRSGATIGAFQRQSRLARQRQTASDPTSTTGGSTPDHSRPSTEDRT
ncbi:sensor histidine kinase [Streptomyces megasporus]|uniref:sensor histidine kinase n=1 Tax=Streptomyces megasporus TaxID=44060 RepID=UPI00068FD729|nr:nitrate- and nitrite sensing domain-containing protein [Streptomyces megasporus]